MPKEFYEKACDELSIGNACGNLSYMYVNGFGVKQDYMIAHKYKEKGCGLKSGLACYNLGVSYLKGQGVRQNRAVAKNYFGKACDLKYQNGCDAYKDMNTLGTW